MQDISRRAFLRRSIASAVGLGIMGLPLKSWASKTQFVPALVIGSGYGGAVAALRLAQAGVHTVVLERGRRWPIQADGNTFATFEQPDGRAAWLSDTTTGLPPLIKIDRYTGVFELIDADGRSRGLGNLAANGVQVRNGAGVGGGSLVNNAIFLQPRRELFQQVFPRHIDYDEMNEIYYPRVRQMLSLATIPDDILATDFYLSTRVNLQQAENAGLFEGSLVEYAIDWDIVLQEIAGTKRPSAIDGQSWYGLNSGAKQSVDKNYLAMAEATGRVEVLPLHVAVDISESKSQGLYYVFANEIDTNGQTCKQHVFATQHLFLAAGSTGTSALLVRARDKGTLPRLNKWVGQDWGINGDFVVVRGELPDNNPGTGGPCGHILMEDLYNPFSVSNMVELVIPKNVRDSFPRSSLYVGLGLAPALGVCTYDPATDAVTFDWPFQDSRLESFSQGAASMLQTLNEANPGSFTAFFSEDPAQSSTAFTAHPVGGAVIGKVCDQFGRVHGHRGLYVVDGALVSEGSVGGVNPAFTIAALAERCVEKIIARDISHSHRVSTVWAPGVTVSS